ncbi:hypothetical protein DPMN_022353 [Dreissena polymorpha]|uniref:Uncharacterized protein n=1 Tax=Dreissena polymorpha TaxID=45954 RepID=A0A9D4NQ75_DREPO|nr:hypothetical protein DPMN_022353 [Dreissena polymorpha]
MTGRTQCNENRGRRFEQPQRYSRNRSPEREEPLIREAGSPVYTRTEARRVPKISIPPFNGKENWDVLFRRFDLLASRHNWSNRE